MPNFRYRAKSGLETVTGIIDAQNRQEAVEKLSQMDYMPMSIEEESGEVKTKTKAKIETKKQGIFFSRIRGKDITIFSRQLASLLKAGVPILKALSIISNQTQNIKLKGMFNNVKDQVKNGETLSSSLEKYPKVFPPLYIAMIRSGESSGMLQDVLLRIADHRKKQEEIISRVRTALAYPVLMSLVGAGTVYFMLTFVMPRIMRVFNSLGQELPLPTKILIGISTVLQKWWYFILLGAISLFFILKKLFTTRQLLFSRVKLAMPVTGKLIHKNELARFSRTLELLVRCGIPLLKGIDTTIPVLNNELMKKELQRSYNELKDGASLGKSLERSKLFPEFMTNLIIVGEESGRLDDVLGEIADSYEKDVDDMLKVMTSMFEPLIILVMGLIVGFIVIAMLMPVFQMNLMSR